MTDADDFARAAGTPGPLFAEAEGGPFARSKVEPKAIERVVAGMIWRHQGRANAISIAKLMAAAGCDERRIKGVVEQLVVTHKMRIGGARMDPVGYYVVVTAEDQAAAVKPYLDQVLAVLRRVQVLSDAQSLRELLGQLRIEE